MNTESSSDHLKRLEDFWQIGSRFRDRAEISSETLEDTEKSTFIWLIWPKVESNPTVFTQKILFHSKKSNWL